VKESDCRIWGSEYLTFVCVVSLFFTSFQEKTTVQVEWDMLQLFSFSKTANLQANIVCNQDIFSLHWSLSVREFLDTDFPVRGIGADGRIL
jgi:hypothetical protein